MTTVEEKARAFAEKAHGTQRYGSEPYVAHLEATRKVLSAFGCEGPVCVAAWLHDVLEDTETTRKVLAAEFGDDVAALVWAVTGVGATRAERLESAFAKVRYLPQALPLKLADRVANVEASSGGKNHKMLATYRAEQAAFEDGLMLVEQGTVQEAMRVRAMWERLWLALKLKC